jgi:hypothetical protein
MIIIIILSLALVGVSGGFIAYAVQKSEKCEVIDCSNFDTESTCKKPACNWDGTNNECNQSQVGKALGTACGYISNKDNCNKVPGCKFGL